MAALSFCAAPHFLRDIVLQSTQVPSGGPAGSIGDARTNRVNMTQKNMEYSGQAQVEKEAKRALLVTKHAAEVEDYAQWRSRQSAAPMQMGRAGSGMGRPVGLDQASRKRLARPQSAAALALGSRRQRPPRPYEMARPTCVRRSTAKATPGFITDHVSQRLYPNPSRLPRHEQETILEQQAQEQAYWTQMGTATFHLNPSYKDPALHISARKLLTSFR